MPGVPYLPVPGTAPPFGLMPLIFPNGCGSLPRRPVAVVTGKAILIALLGQGAAGAVLGADKGLVVGGA
jgi:hypothetical protein